MYLARLTLDPRSAQARRDLGDAHAQQLLGGVAGDFANLAIHAE